MKKPPLDERTAYALTNLRASDDFRQFLHWLASVAQSETHTCTQAKDIDLYRAQGGVHVLNHVFENVENAPGTLEKIRNAK